MAVVLVDTAGIRLEGAGEIEKLGIERSQSEVRKADIVLALFDSSRPLDGEDFAILATIKERATICVATKSDLSKAWSDEGFAGYRIAEMGFVRVSSLARDSLLGLEKTIVEMLKDKGNDSESKGGSGDPACGMRKNYGWQEKH